MRRAPVKNKRSSPPPPPLSSFPCPARFDQMDIKKSKRRSRFTFAPTKPPKELAAYLSNLLRQNKMTDETDNQMERSLKRALRAALHSEDVNKLNLLLKQGLDVNSVVDNVFWETPLLYAVKHTHLEIVESLLAKRECRIDFPDRHGHTALDEAIRKWLLGGGHHYHGGSGGSINNSYSGCGELKQQRGRRFRVLRCVVSAGAKLYTASFVDNLIYSCQNSRAGVAAVEKLVKLVCQKGAPELKSGLLSVLLPHAKMAKCLRYLLLAGADPTRHLTEEAILCQHVPEENAIVVIKATNDDLVLAKIERYLRIPRPTTERRLTPIAINLPSIRASGVIKPKESIRLLLLSSHVLSPQTMHYLRKNQAGLYKIAVSAIREPRPLRYLARVAVRKQCSPNIFSALRQFKEVPLSVKAFLIFEDEDLSLDTRTNKNA